MNLQALPEIPASVRRWKPYPAYTDSGVEWLGTVPSHWKLEKLKFNSYVKGRIGWQNLRAEEFVDEGPYLITGMHFDNGSVDWGACYHITDERYEMAPEIHVKKGDILVTKDGSIGKVAYIADLPGKASLNSHLLLVRPENNQYYPRYLYYLLGSSLFREYILVSQTGTTFFGITQEAVVNFPILLPSFSEQCVITAFLDRETAEIDALVGKKEQLIELLQEKRAALITRAVTKGLDPNAPMKDSDIEWLGEIPAYWEVKKGRHLGRLLGSPNLDAFVVDDEGSIPFMKVDDLNRLGDSLYLEDSTERVRALGKSPPLLEGEIILFPKRGAAIFTNKVRVVKGPVLFDSNLMGWQLFDAVHIKYLAYALLARGLSDLADVSSVPQINNKHIYPSFFPLPPREEQDMIADFLDAETAKIDSVTAKIREGIDKLKEYRTALISAAVTGKIDVRSTSGFEAAN